MLSKSATVLVKEALLPADAVIVCYSVGEGLHVLVLYGRHQRLHQLGLKYKMCYAFENQCFGAGSSRAKINFDKRLLFNLLPLVC